MRYKCVHYYFLWPTSSVNSNIVMVSGGWEGSADIYTFGATIETIEDFSYLGFSYRDTTEGEYQPLGTVTKKSMCESAKQLAFSQN